MVKKIILHGLFKKLACESFTAKVCSFNDLVGCLYANFNGFNTKLRGFSKEIGGFLVLADGKIIENLSIIDEKIRKAKIIELLPIHRFNAYASVTIAFTSIAASSLGQAIAYSVINIIILTAISVGISYLMTKLLSPKQPKQVKTASYIFSSKENAVERNVPIPINYGRLRLGSNVIASAGFSFDLSYAAPSSSSPVISAGALTATI